MKRDIISALLVIASFMLGWTANGYYIYKGFYDHEGKQMSDIAEQINGKHGSK